jgi:hypothetical protein
MWSARLKIKFQTYGTLLNSRKKETVGNPEKNIKPKVEEL